MLPDLRSFAGTMGTPLRAGDSGVEQTISVMRQLIDDAVKDPAVNDAAIMLIRGIADQFSRKAKAQAIYYGVSARFFYAEDPVGPYGPKETLRPVRRLVGTRPDHTDGLWAGDCDDATVLICSLLGTIGIRSRIVTIAADPSAPDEFSHVYPEAEVAPGVWVCMDIARPGAAYGVAPTRSFRPPRIWCIDSGNYRDMNGCRCSNLNGYAVLGDDNPVATDITAVADVIGAAKGVPFSYSSPNTPQIVAPPAGYQLYGAQQPAASLFASPAVLIIIGLGLVFALKK
jgi:hypothetical protein